jgi:hypothetical protein
LLNKQKKLWLLFPKGKTMSNAVLTAAVRILLTVTSRKKALDQAISRLDGYMRLAESLDGERGRRPVEVPPMPGIDEDMRRWSFYMILEHNVIVNRSISAMIRQLVRAESPSGAAAIDMKTGVMPEPSAGEEYVRLFRESVQDHVDTVRNLGKLRGTATSRHVLFGDFDAHKWNGMFSFHLGLHYRQAAYVVKKLNA